MKKLLFLSCILGIGLTVVLWQRSTKPKVYTADELRGLSCAALSERHTEVIDAFHDADIAQHKTSGAFRDDLMPSERDLPFVVVMLSVMEAHKIAESDLTPTNRPNDALQRTRLYSDASALCAANPNQNAVEVMERAARELGLIAP